MMMNCRNIYYCFPGGKNKAITMSYDDGRIEDRRLAALFNRYGIKGTFHLNSGLTDDELRVGSDEVRTLYEGHEVSCHTVLHPTIARCPIDQVAVQILEDRRRLEELAGYPVRGMSYPNGSYTEEIKRLLPMLGIEYSRVVGDTHGFGIPEDFMEWKATCHHNHRLLEDAASFLDLHKTQYLYLMYVWGHSYEFAAEDDWALIERFCELVSGRPDIWFATNIEIVDYLKAARNLHFTVNGDYVENPNACPIWISVDGEQIRISGGTGLQI